MIICIAIAIIILLFFALHSTKSQNSNVFEKDDDLECRYENITAGDLRIMTFNIWYNGKKVDDGIKKIAKHINIINPDAVCLQEVATVHDLDKILEAAEGWNAVSKPTIYTDVAIMSKHNILDETFVAGKFIGAAIETKNGKKIRVVNGHLQFKTGPYSAFNKLVTNISQLAEGENYPKNHSMSF